MTYDLIFGSMNWWGMELYHNIKGKERTPFVLRWCLEPTIIREKIKERCF